MQNQRHQYRLLVLEKHLDTFGHVNNATYLELFEEARWDWLEGNDYGLDTIRKTGRGPTILEIVLRFKRELKNRQAIVIESTVTSYQGKVGHMTQRIVDDAGQVYCEAQFVIGLFDLSARRLIPPTADWLRGIGVKELT